MLHQERFWEQNKNAVPQWNLEYRIQGLMKRGSIRHLSGVLIEQGYWKTGKGLDIGVPAPLEWGELKGG